MAQSRSPGYPSMPLEEAIELVKKIHDGNRTNPLDREAAAKEMGYSGISGRSAKVLSDLAHYGLLEKAGNGLVRVSRRAVEILYPESEESLADALHEAAGSPSLFSELNDQFSDGLPSENALRSYLMRNAFASAAIPPILKSYMDTYRWLEQKIVSRGRGPTAQSAEESGGYESDASADRQEVARVTSPQPEHRGREVSIVEGERVIFVEEANAGQYLKLIATGALDDSLLEALEDFTKRQRKRLGLTRPKEIGSGEAQAGAAAEDTGGEVH